LPHGRGDLDLIEFGELPKTLSGKIRRVELRQRELEST